MDDPTFGIDLLQHNRKKVTMLDKPLMDNESMGGRQVEMAISATGDIVDAYDTYINIHVYGDKYHQYEADKNTQDAKSIVVAVFVRLVFWRTTHKKIVLGTVRPLGVENDKYPYALFDVIRKISAPVEIKDYWKKAFEKHVVTTIAEVTKSNKDLMQAFDDLYKGPEKDLPPMSHVLVYTIPVPSWESSRRNNGFIGDTGDDAHESLNHNCFDGPHGFVRSDSADDFVQKLTDLPVSMKIT